VFGITFGFCNLNGNELCKRQYIALLCLEVVQQGMTTKIRSALYQHKRDDNNRVKGGGYLRQERVREKNFLQSTSESNQPSCTESVFLLPKVTNKVTKSVTQRTLGLGLTMTCVSFTIRLFRVFRVWASHIVCWED